MKVVIHKCDRCGSLTDIKHSKVTSTPSVWKKGDLGIEYLNIADLCKGCREELSKVLTEFRKGDPK